jgi:hypothetical protein
MEAIPDRPVNFIAEVQVQIVSLIYNLIEHVPEFQHKFYENNTHVLNSDSRAHVYGWHSSARFPRVAGALTVEGKPKLLGASVFSPLTYNPVTAAFVKQEDCPFEVCDVPAASTACLTCRLVLESIELNLLDTKYSASVLDAAREVTESTGHQNQTYVDVTIYGRASGTFS